jgi:hypothetical protein
MRGGGWNGNEVKSANGNEVRVEGSMVNWEGGKGVEIELKMRGEGWNGSEVNRWKWECGDGGMGVW